MIKGGIIMKYSIFETTFSTDTDMASRYSDIATRRSVPIRLRLLTAVITVFFLFMLIGPHYQIIEKDGNYYLTMPETTLLFKRRFNGMLISYDTPFRQPIIFSSAEEMQSNFLYGGFSINELNTLAELVIQATDERLPIPDPHSLCEPITPGDVTWNGAISWDGWTNYQFIVASQSMDISFSGISDDLFESRRRQYHNVSSNSKEELYKIEKISDRNATICYTASLNGNNPLNGYTKNKYMIYTLIKGDKTILVRENFRSIHDTESSSIHLLIQEGGCYGSVSIENYTTRPSVDYLLSFGLSPLK